MALWPRVYVSLRIVYPRLSKPNHASGVHHVWVARELINNLYALSGGGHMLNLKRNILGY